MTNPASIPLIIAFCAALAGAGAYHIQVRRLRLERARLAVTSVRMVGDLAEVMVTNVGLRPALDVHLGVDPLHPGVWLEGLAAGGDFPFEIPCSKPTFELVLSYDDPFSGRVGETRPVRTVDGDTLLGPSTPCKPSPASAASRAQAIWRGSDG